MDFAELARAFDAEVVWSAAGKSRTPLRFTIEREGASVHAYPELVESDCVGVVFAVESAATRRLPRVVLREEGALDRGGKSLGINEEIQLDDPAFDDAVYVASEAPALAIRELLADSKARAAVVTALAGPAEELVLGDGRVGALIAASELQDPRAAAIEQTLAAITRVAATLVAPSARALRQKSAARSGRALFMLSGSWLALLIVAA
ncbi:MAG: hypothetical protein KC468_28815, partial [Myxococcales bacterium]|nr:hypothetical protein [Myxococcales bacterium]